MPIFIALGRTTERGLENLESLAGRHEVARRRARDLGGRVIASYATLGRYDFVVLLDCPDLETCMRILSREAAGGNIRYETMTALPTRDFAQIFLDAQALEEERRVLRVGRRGAKRAATTAGAGAGKAGARSAAKADATRATKVARKTPPRKGPSSARRGNR